MMMTFAKRFVPDETQLPVVRDLCRKMFAT